MIAYTSQSRGVTWCGRLVEARFGECTLRGQLPPRRSPWFYDNGAFSDSCKGREFDNVTFERDMRRIRLWSDQAGTGVPGWGGRPLPPPQFIVLPDIVGRGPESLAFTVAFLDGQRVPLGGFPPGVPLYLAVQDGMAVAEVAAVLCHYRLGGIFIGGSLPWKVRTGAQWVRVAHRLGKLCHIGRAMSGNRIAWARRIGADSIDGNAPNWSDDSLRRAVRHRGPRAQAELSIPGGVRP